MTAAAKLEKEMNQFRSEYQAVAKASAFMFFCVRDLAAIDPMYQFSLNWFISLFIKGTLAFVVDFCCWLLLSTFVVGFCC